MANNQTVTRDVMLTNVRLSFASLEKPTAITNPATKQPQGEAKFRATFLLDTTTEEGKQQFRTLWSTVTGMMQERYGPNVKKDHLKHWPIRDGAEKSEIEGYGAGVFFIAANSARRPIIVGSARQNLAPGDTQFPYSGCYVNAKVQFWTQEYMGGKQINTGLVAVQFVRDGEPFSGVKFDVNEFPDGDPGATSSGAPVDDCPI